jgi:hypothetical protein
MRRRPKSCQNCSGQVGRQRGKSGGLRVIVRESDHGQGLMTA